MTVDQMARIDLIKAKWPLKINRSSRQNVVKVNNKSSFKSWG